MVHRLRMLIVVAFLLVMGVPAVATGADIVVPDGDAVAFRSALIQAGNNAGLDRILLGTGTYAAGGLPFSYQVADPLEIVGQGQGTTLLTSNGAGGGAFATLDFQSASQVAVSALSVQGPADAVGFVRAIMGPGLTIHDVTVTGHAGSANSAGLQILGGTAAISAVTVIGPFSRGIEVADGSASIIDTTIDMPGSGSGIEVDAPGATATVTRTRVRAGNAVVASFSGVINVSDTVAEASNVGIVVGDNGNPALHTSGVTADRLTVVAPVGLSITANSAGDNMQAVLRDSIVVATTSFSCSQSAGTASVTADHVNAPGADGGCAGILNATNRTVSAPGFVDEAGRDYRLRFDSALVDAGNPATASSGTDLAGSARKVDGNADGTAVVDLGAFEYQRRPPRIQVAATPQTATVGDTIQFNATATDSDPGETVTSFAWSFDDGAAANGPDAAHAFTTPGSHGATVTVTDSVGASAQATVVVSVLSPPVVTPPPDVAPPQFSAVRAAKTIKIGTGLPRLGAAYTKLMKFTLSEDATVGVRIERLVNGKWRLVAGAFTVSGKAGVNGLRFRGRITAKLKLAPGTYRLRLRATDAAGNRSGFVRARFNLVR